MQLEPGNHSSARPLPADPRSWRRPVLAGVLLLLAGCVAAPFDVRVALWITDGRCLDELEKLACLAEVFAHGFGAAAVMLTVYLLDPARRKFLPRLAVMSLGVGAATDLLKLILARHRPYHFKFDGGTAATFGDWLPGWSAGAGLQSFPSSHSAVAAGLAIGLGWLYPRGRWLFAVFAALALFQRVVVKAHFLSDVLWGGGAGCILAGICLSAACSRWFNRFESGSAGQETEADDANESANSPSRAVQSDRASQTEKLLPEDARAA